LWVFAENTGQRFAAVTLESLKFGRGDAARIKKPFGEIG
jgi:hypothetical protein